MQAALWASRLMLALAVHTLFVVVPVCAAVSINATSTAYIDIGDEAVISLNSTTRERVGWHWAMHGAAHMLSKHILMVAMQAKWAYGHSW